MNLNLRSLDSLRANRPFKTGRGSSVTGSRRRLRLSIEALESRTLLSTVTWIGSSGDWDTASNWTDNLGVHRLPGAADDVGIHVAGGITITHAQNVTDSVNSIAASNPITLSAGILGVAGSLSDTSAVTVSATATLRGGFVSTPNGAALIAAGGTLDGVTLNSDGTLQVGVGQNVTLIHVIHGLTVNGVVAFARRDAKIFVNGSQTIGGTGEIDFFSTTDIFNVAASGLILTQNNTTLTLGPGLTVRGGNQGFGNASGVTGTTVINQGTIDVSQPSDTGSGGLFLNVNTFQNFGTLRTSNAAGALTVNADTFMNMSTGKIQASAGTVTLNFNSTWTTAGTTIVDGGVLKLGGQFTLASIGAYSYTAGTIVITGNLNNTGTTLDLDTMPGQWQTGGGGSIVGGTIHTSGSAQIVQPFTETFTLDGVTLNGRYTTSFGNGGSTVLIRNDLTVNGTLSLAKSTLGVWAGAAGTTQNILGTGVVRMADSPNTGRAARLTQSTDSGTGSAARTVVIHSGVTVQDSSSASGGFAQIGDVGQIWVNQGTITASAAGAVLLVHGRFYNEGTIAVAVGASVSLIGDSLVAGQLAWSNSGPTGTPGVIEIVGGTMNVSGIGANSGTMRIINGALTLAADNFTNTGTLGVFGSGSLTLAKSVSSDQSGILYGQAGTTITAQGNLVGSAQNADQYALQGVVALAGSGTAASPQLLEAMSNDLGNVAAGFHDNFAYGGLALGNNTYVQLLDDADNSAGTGPEAVYVGSLIVPAGTTLDLNGLHFYARTAQINGTIVNGPVSVVGDGGPVPFATLAPGAISTAGDVDDWTFFGRAGHAVQVFVGTGSGSLFAPRAPSLDLAQVQLVGPDGSVVATATNAAGGTDATLQAVTLPAPGTYHIQIQADPGHATNTGSYVLTLWDATVHTAAVNLNETTVSHLASPYAVDHWTFAAAANQQVRFNLIRTAEPGLLFDLTGPNGFTAFSGATSSSSLIDLPAAGTYTLTVHALQPAAGTYAFEMQQTSLTPLTSGIPFNGVFAGSGQAQLFTIATPQDRELLIALKDTNLDDQLEVYAKFGAPPTRADYLSESAVPQSPSQTVLIPKAAPGTWYILVYAQDLAAPPQNYSLTATIAPLAFTAVTPDHLGNAADAVLTLTGAGFDATTTVSLVAGDGTTHPASQVQLDLPTQLSATFTAGVIPAGVYSVVVTRGDGASATRANAFTMDQGGQVHFQANLVVPSALGYHFASTLYLQYSNTGDLAMPAPIIDVTIFQTHANGTTDQKALLTLDSALGKQGIYVSTVPAGFSNTLEVLAAGATPGLLQPGESIQVPIYYAGWQLPWDISYPTFDPELAIETATDTTPIPWSTLQAQFQPPEISTTAWNALFPNLEAQVGNTWGGFVQRLDDDAAYLGHLGEKVTDIAQLWHFEIQQANGFSPVQTLSAATDASVPTTGPALTVDRALPNSINARNQMGPFGMGWQWTSGWQQRLTRAADGTVTITDPDGDSDGALTVFEPDSRGGYFAEPGGHSTLTAVSGGFVLQDADGTQTIFGFNGLISSVRDTHLNSTDAAYTNGLLTSLTATSGQSLAFTHNSAGLITSVTDSTGRKTTYHYDPSNQHLLSVTDFAGRTIAYTYDTSGVPTTANALVSVQNPDGTVEHFTYDAQGRLSQRYVDNGLNGSPTIGQVTYAYGPAGEVAVTDAGGGTTRLFADARGLFVKEEDGLGNATHVSYDGDYNRTQVIDPAGQIINFAYDPNGNLIKITGPNGEVVSATFSGPFNKLASSTDPNGNTTQYAHNSQGDLLSIAYPNGRAHQFSYDPLGNLTESINARGQAIHITRNGMGQVTRATYADGTFQAYAYDGHGHLISATDGTRTTTFQYDPIAEDLVQVNYSGGRSLTLGYDAAGRRSQSVDQDGFTVNYNYNLGLLAGLTDGNGKPIVTYAYDAAGRLIRKDLGNGTSTTYQYDLVGHFLHLVNHAPNGSVNSRFDYTYDSLSHVATMFTLDGMWTYQYDPAGQLTHAVFASSNTSVVPNQDLQYVYDLAGNRTETIVNGVATAYVTNNMNQVTQIGSAHFAYDADGNLIVQTDSSGNTGYAYDELNRLTGVTAPTVISAYQYDPIGNLASMTQNGRTTQYVVDPIGLGNVVGEYDGSGSLIAHYTYGLGLTSRVAAGAQAAYYDFDRIGSTVGMSGAAGSYQNLYRYLPFGQALTAAGTIPNAFQFVGRFGVMAQENGLIFMRARFYSGAQGRFLSPDPLGLGGGQSNLYAYAAQNPLSVIDPSGLFFCREFTDKQILKLIRQLQRAIDQGEADKYNAAKQGLSAQQLTGYLADSNRIIALNEASIERDTKILELPLCPDPPPPPPPPTPGKDCPTLEFGSDEVGLFVLVPCPPPAKSQDPNAKTGPAGFGPQGFITASAALPYRIDFENDPKATAPAQLVVVTDPLNPNIDTSTLQFTEVGFGDNLIVIPAGSQHFQTTVPMTFNGLSFNVRIELGLDSTTGLVTATFQSIDPKTSLPPANVLTGFLPPEDGTGRGLGYFTYTVMPKSGLPTGAQIRNVATVIFDDNPPITTDQVSETDPSKGVDPAKQCLNTIDAVAPTSSVAALPAVSPASFTVSWSGSDNSGGSGIATYDVFVSTDGGPFVPFQSATTATSATFNGALGHTYAFYSLATDNVGFFQAVPTAAQATTATQASQQTTSLSAVSGAGTYAGTASFSATLTEAGLPLVGKTVSFTRNIGGVISDVGSATTNASGVATLGGITLAGISAGAYAGSVSAAFAADAADTASVGSGTLVISQATPKVSWLDPADIISGTALGTTQLNATASVPGIFVYDPASGAILTAGQGRALSATFTPADATDYRSVTTSVTINVEPRPVPPVVVQGVHWQTRKLPHKKPAKVLVVGFSDRLNPADAHALSAFHLVAAGKDKKFGTRDDKLVPIASATYDPGAHSLTLTPRGTVPNQTLQLSINAALIPDATGRPIDGNGDGQPGGNFQAQFGKAGVNIARTSSSGLKGQVSAAAFDSLAVITEHRHGAERPGSSGGHRGDREGVAAGFGRGRYSLVLTGSDRTVMDRAEGSSTTAMPTRRWGAWTT